MNLLEQILAYLNDPVYKGLVIYALTFLFRIKPELKTATPVLSTAVNVLLAIITLWGEAATGPVKPASFSLANAVAPAAGFNVLLDVILPQLIADGVYNWPRKVWAWLKTRIK